MADKLLQVKSERTISMGSHLQAWRRRVRAGQGFLLGLGALAGGPAAAQSFVPPQSTVVLLAGLAGDVESEAAFRDQLGSWLEFVGNSGQAQRLFVLCDNPESVTLPPKMEGKVLRADRSSFQGLNQMLAAGTKALVVIAVGHGGRQGSTPVLHVRGPRLTPADFEALAAQVPTVESRWILMFRGSGSFATKLAGAKRQILSSECETMFTSDPIGMNVLLKILREQPTLSFGALAEELGSATVAWYGERNLARTEEPTLWVAEEKPRLLAEAGKNALASVNPEESEKPKEAPKATTLPRDLPSTWKQITRVEPQKYPEADGVTLRRRLSYTVGSHPALATETEEFIQVLTPEGKHLGDFDVSYSPPSEDISFQDCEVLRPDGKLVRLDPDAIHETRDPAPGDYQSGRRKFFSLPGVGPGAVLHVRYRTEWKDFPLPHVSLEVPIGLELPAREALIEVTVPKDAPFHFALDHLAAPDPVVKQGSYGATYSWHFENLPAQRHEILASPGQQPRLLFSTFTDWKGFADWYGRLSQLTDEVTPEIAARAKELTRDAKTEREKVLALYNYVTALRYVAVPLGVNSFRPHAAANVLRNQFGDCKDKANLFNTLLRALDIEAHLVLVPRFSQAHDDIPGLAFNHAISRVALGTETVWVDTTDDICRFGLLPPGDPGRKVLVIDGETRALTPLPLPKPRENQLKLHGEAKCSSPAEAVPVTLSVTALGFPDYELRAVARETREQNSSLPLLAAWFRPAAGAFGLEKQSATAVSALSENFSWQAEGKYVGAFVAAGGQWRLHSPFWLPKEWDLALHRRQTALFLNQGYPLALEEEFEWALPAQAQLAWLPEARENQAEPLRWSIEWKRAGENKLTARLSVELVRGELSLAETPVLQSQLRDLLGALAAGASLTPPP